MFFIVVIPLFSLGVGGQTFLPVYYTLQGAACQEGVTGRGGVWLNFLHLRSRAHTAMRVRCTGLCLFFALPQRIGEEKAPRDLMSLGTLQCEKVAALRSAHLFAEIGIFSFCECDLKKVALTKVARKRNSKSLRYLRRTLRKLIFKQKRFSSSSAARGGYMARDSFRRAGALRSRFCAMLAFSEQAMLVCLGASRDVKSGNAKGNPRGNVRAGNVCARAKRDVRVQRTSKLAISACRNLFSFAISL